MVELDISEIVKNYPLSLFTVYFLGFVLTYFGFFAPAQFTALFVSSTVSLFILSPLTELTPSIKKSLSVFPVPVIISYALWILNFVATHTPIPLLINHLALFFFPMLIGLSIFIIWDYLNKGFQKVMTLIRRSRYWSNLITSIFLICMGLVLMMSLNLSGLIITQTVNATAGG